MAKDKKENGRSSAEDPKTARRGASSAGEGPRGKPSGSPWGKGPRRRLGRKKHRAYAMSQDERKAARRSIVLKAVACILVLALCLALALVVGTDEYRPSAVGWIPFISVAAAIACAFVYLQVLKRSIRILEKSNITECRRDEKVRFKVRLANRSPLFYFRIEAHFYTADLYGNPVNHAATTLALAPFEKYDLPFTTKFEHIGTYQAGLDRIVVYDFLRLFSATIEGPKRVKVNVAPKIVAIPDLRFSNDAVVETTKAARSVLSDSMDYAAVREYVWGDPLKNVHWKISARTDELMTKLFETYTNPGVAIIMDFYGPGQDARELMHMFDAVVEAGFSVARYAQTRGMDTEIHYVDKTGMRVHRNTWKMSELPQIVADMPRFSSHPDAAADALGLLEEQIHATQGQNNIVMCTANLSASMIELVAAAKVHRREPMLFAVVPRRLEGHARDQWLAPLARLDALGIGYLVLTSSADLLKVKHEQ